MSDTASEREALLDALSVERSAVFGCGAAGGRIDTPDRPSVQAAEDAHRARAETLERVLSAQGEDVPIAPTWYDVPSVTDPATAITLLVELEEATARAWRGIVEAAQSPDAQDLRSLGSAAMTDAASRATQWRIRKSQVSPVAAGGQAAALAVAAPAWPGA